MLDNGNIFMKLNLMTRQDTRKWINVNVNVCKQKKHGFSKIAVNKMVYTYNEETIFPLAVIKTQSTL